MDQSETERRTEGNEHNDKVPTTTVDVNMEVQRYGDLTETEVAEKPTPAMTMETTLQTGLKFGLVVNLDSGCDFKRRKTS